MATHNQTVVGPKVRAIGIALVLLMFVSLDARARGPSDLWTLGPASAKASARQALGPTRIVSLVPAVTEMLFAIGAGDDVVGVSSYDSFPPEARTKPRVGALVDPDFERILSLRPDLVVVYGTQVDLVGRLERARIAMFRYEHAGLADITSTIRAIGDRIGRTDRARALADGIDRDIEATRRSVAGKPRPKTVLIFGREEGALRAIYASGGIGFMHDMLEAAGALNLFADVKRQNVQATTELLLTRAPDVIIEVHTGEPWTADRIAQAQRVWSGLPSLPAVKTGRIYELIDDRLSIPGPRVAEAVRVLARVLHP